MITDEEVRQYGCSVEYSFLGGGATFDLDWYRPDQSWRSFRLHRVAGYLRAVADSTKDYDLLRKLARICDHKGELTCYWHELPTDGEKEILKQAWDSECEDGIFIEHELEELATDDEKSALEKAWNSEAESGDMIEHELEEEV
jgi:hypothetical protein